MKKTTIIAVILGVLVLISVVQAFQLNGLKTKIADGQTALTSNTKPAGTQANVRTTGSVPKSVQNLPQMVGGC